MKDRPVAPLILSIATPSFTLMFTNQVVIVMQVSSLNKLNQSSKKDTPHQKCRFWCGVSFKANPWYSTSQCYSQHLRTLCVQWANGPLGKKAPICVFQLR